MLRRKERAALAALVVLALWPAVHHALYRIARIDPWKLCGFAMYSRPHAAHQLALWGLGDGTARELTVDTPALAAVVERVGRRRGALGALQPVDPIGRAALEAHPELDAVRIIVRRIAFDCRSARIDDVDTLVRTIER